MCYCISKLIQRNAVKRDHCHQIKKLCQAILTLKSEEEMCRFFKDLCTPGELSDLSERWLVCCLLREGERSYREIHRLTGVSPTTIGRVARFLREEDHGGYQIAFERLEGVEKER